MSYTIQKIAFIAVIGIFACSTFLGVKALAQETLEEKKIDRTDKPEKQAVPKMEDNAGLAKLVATATRGRLQHFNENMHRPFVETDKTIDIPKDALKSLTGVLERRLAAPVEAKDCPRSFFLCGGIRVKLWLGDDDTDWIELRGESWSGAGWLWATTSFWPGGRWVRGGFSDLATVDVEDTDD
ncbi:hypothetical protein OAU50_03040 [Planctomycetota bacterium]|nr:hypothetical protein [Planctomycetota bacterium]